jgi:hypothetical protein
MKRIGSSRLLHSKWVAPHEYSGARAADGTEAPLGRSRCLRCTGTTVGAREFPIGGTSSTVAVAMRHEEQLAARVPSRALPGVAALATGLAARMLLVEAVAQTSRIGESPTGKQSCPGVAGRPQDRTADADWPDRQVLHGRELSFERPPGMPCATTTRFRCPNRQPRRRDAALCDSLRPGHERRSWRPARSCTRSRVKAGVVGGPLVVPSSGISSGECCGTRGTACTGKRARGQAECPQGVSDSGTL